MLLRVLVIAVLICGGISLAQANPAPREHGRYAADDGDVKGAPMDKVIGAIKDALQKANDYKVDGFDLKISKVKLDLATVVTKEAGAKLNFLIFSIGGKVSKEDASTVSVELTRPAGNQGSPQALDRTSIEDAMANAIISAKESYVAASKIDSHLIGNSVTIAFNFTVKYEGSAGAKLQILPVGVDVSGSASKAVVHTVTLVFS